MTGANRATGVPAKHVAGPKGPAAKTSRQDTIHKYQQVINSVYLPRLFGLHETV